ncbi:MAG TPA: DNA-formamidopyrimidine glycosylase family protein [Terracidiphilus sp.]|jgi:endonuclease-8
MPEGDTIFRSARTLNRALSGKAVTGFRSTYPLLTRFHDNTPLTGQIVESVESRGKWLLMHFSGGGILATHMLMNGSWHIYRPGERWKAPGGDMRIVVETGDFQAVGFRVPVAEMLDARKLARDRRIPPAASDVLGSGFDEEGAVRGLMAQGDLELGDALLRQKILAGVGNVFKSEVCFLTGLNPFRTVETLTEAQVRAVVAMARKQLGANVLEDSGNAIVTYQGRKRRTTNQSDPSENLWVYARKGQACRRCGTLIRRRLQGKDARSTYWCPGCQPTPDGREIDG